MNIIVPKWRPPAVEPDTKYTQDLDRGLDDYFKGLDDTLSAILKNPDTIADANGTLADATAKINLILARLKELGITQ